MNETYADAFQILFVGMITVFFILLVVVVVGQLLIRIVNRMSEQPAEQVTPSPNPVPSETETSSPLGGANRAQVAAISTAVAILSRGQAKVVEIERV